MPFYLQLPLIPFHIFWCKLFFLRRSSNTHFGLLFFLLVVERFINDWIESIIFHTRKKMSLFCFHKFFFRLLEPLHRTVQWRANPKRAEEELIIILDNFSKRFLSNCLLRSFCFLSVLCAVCAAVLCAYFTYTHTGRNLEQQMTQWFSTRNLFLFFICLSLSLCVVATSAFCVFCVTKRL